MSQQAYENKEFLKVRDTESLSVQGMRHPGKEERISLRRYVAMKQHRSFVFLSIF